MRTQFAIGLRAPATYWSSDKDPSESMNPSDEFSPKLLSASAGDAAWNDMADMAAITRGLGLLTTAAHKRDCPPRTLA